AGARAGAGGSTAAIAGAGARAGGSTAAIAGAGARAGGSTAAIAGAGARAGGSTAAVAMGVGVNNFKSCKTGASGNMAARAAANSGDQD
ncbi:MAG: hypothetical protein AAB036_06060, partial [Elusimicrobiota bacterium]